MAEAMLARRSDVEWIVGSATAGPDQTDDLSLRFLNDGRYEPTLMHKNGREALDQAVQTVDVDMMLPFSFLEKGGFYRRLRPSASGLDPEAIHARFEPE